MRTRISLYNQLCHSTFDYITQHSINRLDLSSHEDARRLLHGRLAAGRAPRSQRVRRRQRRLRPQVATGMWEDYSREGLEFLDCTRAIKKPVLIL